MMLGDLLDVTGLFTIGENASKDVWMRRLHSPSYRRHQMITKSLTVAVRTKDFGEVRHIRHVDDGMAHGAESRCCSAS